MTITATGNLVHLDPRDVVVGTNVRLDTRLDKAFVDSIRERGVLVPIVGYYNEAGQFVVLYGQRRTYASVTAGRDTIPAYVVEGQDEADRLIDQMAENDHRKALTKSERVQGFAELVGLGMTAADVAKRTATKTATVKAAVTIARSEVASEALSAHKGLTLDEAAGIAEFEDDPEKVAYLLEQVGWGRSIKHTLQRFRDDRAEKAMTDAAAEQWRAEGLTVVDAPDHDDPKCKRVLNLVDAADGEEISEEDHAVCPGHAVYPYVRTFWVDPPEDAPEGARPTREQRVVAAVVCTDYPANGHKSPYGSGSGKKSAEDMTEEEREAAKAARRDVIDSNKAWLSAEKIRMEFLREFLTRKSAPRTASQFLALTMVFAANYVSDYKLPGLYADLLGVEGSTYDKSATALIVENANPDRAQVLALGYVLAGYELTLSTQSWRSVNDNTARYLTFLADNGYELSDVEKRAAGVE